MTVAPVIVAAIVPVLSVLLGAGMTYWLNVRTRRRTHVDDLFNDAIAAVAVADASQFYVPQVVRPRFMSEQKHDELLADIALRAIEGNTQRAAEAREALARVLPYEPRVRPMYTDAQAVLRRPDEIIDLLRDAQRREARRRRRAAVDAREPRSPSD